MGLASLAIVNHTHHEESLKTENGSSERELIWCSSAAVLQLWCLEVYFEIVEKVFCPAKRDFSEICRKKLDSEKILVIKCTRFLAGFNSR